jgi:selenocysteine lyase/cysteine desulfurase
VLIDGAHALGQLEVDVASLGADYFVSNCHKWLCGPRGSAVLHVARQHQAAVRPLVVSHGWGSGFSSEFMWDGCRDYAPLLGVSSALDFWAALGGGAAARAYMRSLLAEAVALLLAAWRTHTLVPLSLCASMALVRLPRLPPLSGRGSGGGPGGGPDGPPADSADAKWAQDALHAGRVECPVKCIGGGLYVRISAAAYNVPGDYAALAAAVGRLAALPEGAAGAAGGGGGAAAGGAAV